MKNLIVFAAVLLAACDAPTQLADDPLPVESIDEECPHADGEPCR